MKWKYSNCLIECVKEFIKYPLRTSIRKKGSYKLILRKKQFPHFYWYNKKDSKYYHFNARFSDEPLLSQLWFQGKVDEFYYHKTEK